MILTGHSTSPTDTTSRTQKYNTFTPSIHRNRFVARLADIPTVALQHTHAHTTNNHAVPVTQQSNAYTTWYPKEVFIT